MNEIKQVVLVGHCGFDAGSLQRAVAEHVGSVPVRFANGQAELDAVAGPESLLLINRVLDGRFNERSGVELIRQLAGQDSPPRMMLVSNYDDAQEEAQSAGALPGVGKASLQTEKAAQRLRDAVGASAQTR